MKKYRNAFAATLALICLVSCAEQSTVVEGPRSRAARSSTTTSQREVTVEEDARVNIPSKPARSDGNYLRHDGG